MQSSLDDVWRRLKELEGIEFETKTGKPFTFEIDGDVFRPTDDEKAKQRRDKLFRPLDPWTYFPTGLFSLVILDEYRRDRIRISDRKNGIRLEEQLNQVVVSIVAEAAKQQHQRQVALENRQRAELEMRERWERQRIR